MKSYNRNPELTAQVDDTRAALDRWHKLAGITNAISRKVPRLLFWHSLQGFKAEPRFSIAYQYYEGLEQPHPLKLVVLFMLIGPAAFLYLMEHHKDREEYEQAQKFLTTIRYMNKYAAPVPLIPETINELTEEDFAFTYSAQSGINLCARVYGGL